MMSIEEKRQLVVKTAEGLVGRKEADASHREIIDVYNAIRPLPRGYRMRYDDPWCAAFVSAVGAMAGLSCALLPECGCVPMAALYRARGEYRARGYDARPGDLIFYSWDENDTPDHVGIIVAKSAEGYTVVEGNMGDAVGRRYVPKGWARIAGFAAPDYACGAEESTPEPPGAEPEPISAESLPLLARGSRGLTVKAMQAILIARGCSCGPDGADGDFGGNTETALRRFQREEGLSADGVCGVRSWRALLGLTE